MRCIIESTWEHRPTSKTPQLPWRLSLLTGTAGTEVVNKKVGCAATGPPWPLRDRTMWRNPRSVTKKHTQRARPASRAVSVRLSRHIYVMQRAFSSLLDLTFLLRSTSPSLCVSVSTPSTFEREAEQSGTTKEKSSKKAGQFTRPGTCALNKESRNQGKRGGRKEVVRGEEPTEITIS